MDPLPAVVFQHDVRVSVFAQDEARQKACLELKARGWTSLGIEFLFINQSEMTPGEKMKRRLESWRDFMHAHFEHAYFSVHAPWRPDNDCLLAPQSPQQAWLTDFQALELDFIDCINIHPGHPTNTVFDQRFSSPADRRQALDLLIETIALLPRPHEICVETLYPSRDGQDYVAFLGCLPSHFQRIVQKTTAGWTLDTAHAAIMIDACAHMVSTKTLLKGFFADDWNEIRAIAQRGFDAFLDTPRLRHLHFANWDPSPQGAWDGFELDKGKIALSDFERILSHARGHATKTLGANLEINEDDYQRPERVIRSLEFLRANGLSSLRLGTND